MATSPNGPATPLPQWNDGSFYGTAVSGGIGLGTVFRISPGGDYTNLYVFGGTPDGSYPWGGLVQGADGNFYGTTTGGGTAGLGTVFKISSGGTYTNLYSFGDGNTTHARLVQGNDGNFYGTTYPLGYPDGGNGAVFKITPTGSYTTLYSFGPTPDGRLPTPGLVQDGNGNFYGTTRYGGTADLGTVFKITAGGSLTVLYSFGDSPDGNLPYGRLVLGSDGNFYGTTQFGGRFGNNAGTVFEITPDGSYSNLYSFADNPDGRNPTAGLVQANDGSFYGVTAGGGVGAGTVFRFSVPLDPPANRINAIQRIDTNIVVRISSVAGEMYQLQFRNSLIGGNWSNSVDVPAARSIGGPLTVTNFGGASQPQKFYRFEMTP